MYAWLDGHGAKECGDSVACFWYDHPSSDILQDVKDDLNNSVELDAKKNRIYVIRLVEGRMKGNFIFGHRRNAPWAGAAGTGEQGEDNG
jgi:homospermidine synthase